MKNVADFKRELIEGRTVKMVHHVEFKGRDEKGIAIYGDAQPVERKVKKVFSTQVCFETPEGKESWIQFPKASKCIIQDNKVTYLEEDHRVANKPLIPLLTYIL